MTNPSGTQGRSAATSARFPSVLREITATVRVPDSAFAFQEILQQLETKPSVTVRKDREGVRGAARGSPGWGSFHTHFVLEKRRSGEFDLELEVTGRQHGRFPKGSLSTTKLIRAFASALEDSSRTFPAIVGAHYILPLDRWAPTVQLPFAPPGTLDHIPGVPQISGLDFSFSAPGPEQPLLRAFISTYGQLNEMIVRILLATHIAFQPSMPLSLAELAGSYLPRFAKEIKPDA